MCHSQLCITTSFICVAQLTGHRNAETQRLSNGKTYGCINSIIFTVAQTDTFFWFVLGCVPLPLWVECLSRGEGNRQIGHILWSAGTIPEEDWMGRVVVKAERGGLCRCEAQDKRERLSQQDNGFLFECSANCLSGRSGFEQRHVYLRIRRWENAKTRVTKSPCAVYWGRDLTTADCDSSNWSDRKEKH